MTQENKLNTECQQTLFILFKKNKFMSSENKKRKLKNLILLNGG